MKKWIKITSIVTAVIAVIVLAVAVSIAPLAKNYIEKHDRELLGRSIRMERLKFNIFTGRLRIGDLRIGGADDSTTFFRLDSFEMRMRLWPLLSNRVVVKKLSFAAPGIKVYQRGNSFSFDDILAHFAGDTIPAAATPEKPSKPWEIGFYVFSIRDEGAVLNFAEGGSLSTDVVYNIATSEFDIGIRLQDFALAGTLPYFRQALDVAAVDGRLSADIRLRGNTEHLLSLRTEGTASLAGFALRDRQQRPVVGVDTLGMKLAEGDMGSMRFRFDRIYAAGVSALFEMTPEGDNFSALMKPTGSTAGTQAAGRISESGATDDAAQDRTTAPDAPGDVTPTLRIADLEIARGSVTVRDLTLHRPFEYTVSQIGMHSRDFDPSKHNKLTVDARMQKTGSAKLRWEGALDNIDNQNITLWLSNLALRDFGPNCEHFTAYQLTKRSQNVIRDRYLDCTNHLDMFESKVVRKR